MPLESSGFACQPPPLCPTFTLPSEVEPSDEEAAHVHFADVADEDEDDVPPPSDDVAVVLVEEPSSEYQKVAPGLFALMTPEWMKTTPLPFLNPLPPSLMCTLSPSTCSTSATQPMADGSTETPCRATPPSIYPT